MERLPILFLGQWAFPSGLFLMFSQSSQRILWLVAVMSLAVIAGLLLQILKRNRVARFFALGMMLSLIPPSATFPDDRLLLFVGFGGMGLLAQLLAAVWRRAEWVPSSRMRRLPFRVACWVFVAIHLVLSPLGLATTAAKVRVFGEFIDRAASSLPSDAAVEDQSALIVNTPSAFISFYGPLVQALHGRKIPGRTLILGSGIHPTTISRPATNVLAIHPDGWLPGRARQSSAGPQGLAARIPPGLLPPDAGPPLPRRNPVEGRGSDCLRRRLGGDRRHDRRRTSDRGEGSLQRRSRRPFPALAAMERRCLGAIRAAGGRRDGRSPCGDPPIVVAALKPAPPLGEVRAANRAHLGVSGYGDLTDRVPPVSV